MQERIERNERSVACRQGNPKELPEKVDKFVNGLDRLYKKAYGMVPHSRILKCLEMVRGAKNMITIISNSMMNWKTVLTSGGTDLGQVDIRRGIFQGTPYHHCCLF